MEILIAVIFLINGEPTILEGFEPLVQPSIEICEVRKDFMEVYLKAVPGLPEIAGIFCGTSEEIQREIDLLNDELL